jgi:hypothetical protein
MKQPANYADRIFDSVVENVKLKHIINLIVTCFVIIQHILTNRDFKFN